VPAGGGGGFPALAGGSVYNANPNTNNAVMAALANQYVIPYNPAAVRWDSGGVVDQPNNRLIVPANGLYLVTYNVYIACNTTPAGYSLYCYCYNAANAVQTSILEGIALTTYTGQANNAEYRFHSVILPANATDYFNLQAQRNSGGSNTDYMGVNWFSITKIAPHP
jgi:hypothetical protein